MGWKEDQKAKVMRMLHDAGEPSLELDGLIWCVRHGVKFKDVFETGPFGNVARVSYTEPPKRTYKVSREALPRFTSAYEDAMSLVAEGSYVRTHTSRERDFNWAWVEAKNTEASSCKPVLALALAHAAMQANES